jgi:TolB-like protein
MSFFNELKRRNVVRVSIGYVIVAWLVAQVVELAADSFGAPDWVMKMVITLLTLGLPFAIFFAWAFELTPEGIKREKDVDRSQSIAPQTGRKLDRAIIVVLVLALGYFVADKFWLSPVQQAETAPQAAEVTTPAEKTPETIAVLPFVDMSPAGDNEYFSDGLTEELLNILAKIENLQVAGRTSSFAFKGKNEDLRSIGQKLGVKTILEGSVRKDEAGQRVRITAQLVNVENGFHLWSESYDRELKDIFAIQDEIAHEVAAALRITLLGEDEQRLAARATTDLNAYELYLQALQQFNDFSYASLRKAEQLFAQSIALDHDYVPAQLGLVRTLQELNETGALSEEEKNSRARPMLESILAEDPNNSEAHVQMALLLDSEDDIEGMRRELDLALRADPRNTNALKEMGRFIFDSGNSATGLEYLREAERLDPYSVPVLWDLCFTQALMLNPDAAKPYCDRIGDIQPGNPMRYYGPSMAAQFSGNLVDAAHYQRKAMELDPNDHELPASQAMYWLSMGDLQRAEPFMQKAELLGANETATVAAKVMMFHYREQPGMAGDLARRALESGLENRAGSKGLIETAYVASMVAQGKASEALEYYRNEVPKAFEHPMPANIADAFVIPGDLITIAGLMFRLDPKSEQAETLLKASEDRILAGDGASLPWLRALALARIAAIRGHDEQALAYLQTAVDNGLRYNWRGPLEISVDLQRLHDKPRFRELVAQVEADMARQREQAIAMLEGGS